MIKFKGTKGNWELSEDGRNIEVLTKPHTYKTICSNFYNTKWQYDAKLIASAPEMLEMLIKLNSFCTMKVEDRSKLEKLIKKALT